MSIRDLIKQAILEASDDVIRQVYEILDIEEGPEIPEGFERWDGGDCPVPGDCLVEVILDDGEETGILQAKYLRWSYFPIGRGRDGNIIAYRVTHVPTLTIDDDVTGYFVIDTEGEIEYVINEGLACDYRNLNSQMAYRTEEHAETACKWGLLHDVYYTKMGFERPVI